MNSLYPGMLFNVTLRDFFFTSMQTFSIMADALGSDLSSLGLRSTRLIPGM